MAVSAGGLPMLINASRVGRNAMSDRTFLDKSWDAQRKVEKKIGSIGKGRYARVLRMARKPEPEEFKQTSNIVLVGIAIIGGIGFAIFLLLTWFQRALGI